MKEKQLLTELATALRLRADAKKVWADKRAAALEARGKYNEQVALVEEIQGEIETGVTGRPLLDAINDRAAANGAPVASRSPKHKQADPKLADLRYETTKETLDRLIEETAATKSGPPPPAAAAQSVEPRVADAPGSTPGRPVGVPSVEPKRKGAARGASHRA